MGGAALINRVLKKSTKSITFDGVSVGLIGTVPVFTVTGLVWIQMLASRCLATLTGATATIALGTAGNTAALIAQTTGTNITNGLIWNGASPATGVAGVSAPDFLVNLSIIATIATANLTGGNLRFECYWLPMSPDGNLS